MLLITIMTDTLLNVFLAIAVDNLANAQELTKVCTVFYLRFAILQVKELVFVVHVVIKVGYYFSIQ